MCREFNTLVKPDSSNEEAVRAWLRVGKILSKILIIGTEICDQGVACLTWKKSPGLNCCIAEFGKALTKLSVETCSPPYHQDERKKLQQV